MAGFQDTINCKEAEVAEMHYQIKELQHEHQHVIDKNIEELKGVLKGLDSMHIDDQVMTNTKSNLSIKKVSI